MGNWDLDDWACAALLTGVGIVFLMYVFSVYMIIYNSFFR